MATFPSTPKPNVDGSGRSKEYILIESKFENNFSQTRRGATKGVLTFTLQYKAITDAEYETLEAFFDANVGTTFYFVDPRTNITHTVKFVDGKLNATYVPVDRHNLSITLVEA